jgi:hypothetical protein
LRLCLSFLLLTLQDDIEAYEKAGEKAKADQLEHKLAAAEDVVAFYQKYIKLISARIDDL